MGELSAMEWLASKGAHIYVPVGHSPDVDFIAEVGSRLLRIEVKSCTCENARRRWAVSICTRGGNQSWSGLVKYFEAKRCDYLFAVVGDGRRWFIPSAELDGKTSVTLGGPKYAEFEVEPGRPLIGDDVSASRIAAGKGGRRSRRAGPACKVGASVLSGFDSHPPHSLSSPTVSPRQTEPAGPGIGRTRMSKNHQVSVPLAVAAAAELAPGDRFRVESDGRGRFVMKRIEESQGRTTHRAPDEPPTGNTD